MGVVDTYKGMTAEETHCNICHVHKGRSHSMPMAERARRIKAETYLPKAEARAAREERLHTGRKSGFGTGQKVNTLRRISVKGQSLCYRPQ